MILRFSQTITICLCVSVALNAYLLWPKNNADHKQASQQAGNEVFKAPVKQIGNVIQANQLTRPDDTPQSTTTSFADARRWLDDGKFAEVERYLIQALIDAPQSAELLLLEADLILATKPLSTAVLHFYTLLESAVLSPTQHEALAARTQTLISNAIDALYNARDWDLLARFIEPLYQLNSNDERLTLKLAEAYARQQKFTLMEDTLASLAPDNAGARSIRQRYFYANELREDSPHTADKTQPAQQLTRIPLTRYGDQYIVDASVLKRPAALLIDTGASSTAISFELYRALKRFHKISVMGLFDVRTAGGLIRSPLIRVKSMQLGPYQLTDIGVLVLPRDTMLNADGLLGMNVLKQFNFTLEQRTSELLLTPR